MKTLTISTKSQANRLLVESLFKPVNGATLQPERYDSGKYKTDPATPFVGRSVEVHDSVHAIWPEKRRDSAGPYVAFFCLSSRQ